MKFIEALVIISLTAFTNAQWQQQHQLQTYSLSPELQQRIAQLRQVINRPQTQSYFARLPSGEEPRLPEDDVDYDEPSEDLMQQELQTPQDVPIKHHPLLPVLLGLIPSACGRKVYNNHKEFCYKNRLYNREKFGTCGPRIYKKEKFFCFNGQTFYKIRKGLCGNGIYDKLTQICLNHQVKNICAGEIFDSRTHFCYERIYNRVNYAMCAKRVYRKSTHYCLAGKIYAKRKWIPNLPGFYTPKELQLWGRRSIHHHLHNRKAKIQAAYHPWKTFSKNQVSRGRNLLLTVRAERKDLVPPQAVRLGQCGKAQYDTKGSFCYEGIVNKRCGQMAYNPNTLLCYRNFLYTRGLYDLCGNEMFNKFTQSCANGHILRHDLNPQVQKLFLDYGTEKENDRKEQQDIYNLSKQLAEKRRDFRERHEFGRCGTGVPFNKRSHFCYNGKLYTRSAHDMCGTMLYDKTTQRCLGAGQIFPIIDLNKPTFYLGGGMGQNSYNINGRR